MVEPVVAPLYGGIDMHVTEFLDPGTNLRAEALDAIDAWAPDDHGLLEASCGDVAPTGLWPTLA
jgi:hypothetical protein